MRNLLLVLWPLAGCKAVLFLISLLLLPLMVTDAYSAPLRVTSSVLFIFDSSGSMLGHVDGEPKAESAKRILVDVLNELPPDANLGLMTYGHRRKGDCTDIELVSPIGSKTAVNIAMKVGSLKPKGNTPIADSLMRAADAFKGIDGAKMIVLITDGGEECKGNPCAAAKQLAASGLAVRINVVGFSLDKDRREEVACIAKEGNGRFFAVSDKKALFAAMTEIKEEIMPPEVIPPETQTATVSPVVTTTTAQTVPAKVPAPVVPVPPSPAAAKPDEVNLLLPSEGGRVAVAAKAGWENIINGRDRSYLWASTGQEVVFSFKDDKPAKFSRFAIGIPGKQPQNVNEFELLVSEESPDGPYKMLGHFKTQNNVQKSLYQEFSFSEATGKYVKFRLVSNYGYETMGWGNTQIYQIRLMGRRM